VADAQRTTYVATIPYVSVVYADGYMAERVGRDAWPQLPQATRLQCLKAATLDLDKLQFIGERDLTDQVREWPRNIYTSAFTGTLHDIPDRLAWATCEQAWFIAKNHITGSSPSDRMEDQDQGLSAISRVGASESFDLNLARRRAVCKAAYDWVRDFVAKTGNLTRDMEEIE